MAYKRIMVRETRESNKEQRIDFLLDSGAFHSLVPSSILSELSVELNREKINIIEITAESFLM